MTNRTDTTTDVVKWYTRARRFPQLIGKTPDGATIWGGPYTYTQVIAGVAVIIVGSKTTWLWGHFGLIGNALILLGVTYGLVLLLGRVPVGSRNPLSVGAGVLRAMTAPTLGTRGGSPVRVRRPHRSATKVVVTPDAPTLGDVHVSRSTPPPPPPPRPKRPRRRPRWSRPAPSQHPVHVVAPPPPRALPEAGGPKLRDATSTRPARQDRHPIALTGVQRLLASTGAPHQED